MDSSEVVKESQWELDETGLEERVEALEKTIEGLQLTNSQLINKLRIGTYPKKPS